MGTQDWDWVFHTLGWTLAGLGLLLALWALFWDRSRGRERCPKCWYSMEGAIAGATGAYTCPECGCEALGPDSLVRTRRRWRRIFPALLVCLLGYGSHHTPGVRRDGWIAVVPTTALVMIASPEDFRDHGRNMYRTHSSAHELYQRISRRSVFNWQTDILVWRFRRHSENEGSAVEFRSYSLSVLFSETWWRSPVRFESRDWHNVESRLWEAIWTPAVFFMQLDVEPDAVAFIVGGRLYAWLTNEDQTVISDLLALLEASGKDQQAKVVISGTESDPSGQIETRLYDVSDLAPSNVRRHIAPPPDPTDPFSTGGFEDGMIPLSGNENIWTIADIIQTNASFDDWVGNGGNRAVFSIVPGRLIITAPPELHEQIVDILMKLRGGVPEESGTP